MIITANVITVLDNAVKKFDFSETKAKGQQTKSKFYFSPQFDVIRGIQYKVMLTLF